MRRSVVVLGAVLAVAGVLSACSSSKKSSDASTTAATTTAATTSAAVTTSASAPASTLFGPSCATLGLTAETNAAAAGVPVGTVAAAVPFLKNTVAAATAAGLITTLNSAPAITVFAPTDEAFNKEPAGQLQKLLTDPKLKPTLIATLQYGVLTGKVDKAALPGSHVTLQGQKLTITGSGDNYVINGKAKILCGGIQASNAVVYIVDTVLHPAA